MYRTYRIVIVATVSFFSCLLAPSFVTSQNALHVTRISRSSDTYRVVLNNSIELNSVRLSSGSRIESVPGVELVKKELEEQVLSAILSGVPGETSSSRITYEVLGKESSEEIGAGGPVSVLFNGSLRVECRVMRGEKRDWLLWPDSFKLKKRAFQKFLEKKILMGR